MKSRLSILLLLGFLISPAWGADAPPSEASIHELMDVTHAQKLVDGIIDQTNGLMLKSVQQANGGAPLDPQEKKIAARAVGKLTDVMRQQMSWEKMQPMMIDLYKKTFSQNEINDMLAFYRTPSGQAVIQKMPALMNQTMAISQAKIQAMLPQIRDISAEMGQELQAYHQAHPKPASP
ncbi:DUF2059 domain-containing protein [Pinirhizobacter soli]|uniref:DUF2059 domain-containing protein n=1 Tax=Pinirhizobacter soli TaxID=2786953 RepID=UPI00202A2EA1